MSTSGPLGPLVFFHVPVVHMLLTTFAKLNRWPYMLFWQEMTSRHLTLRQSECNLAGSDETSPLSMDSKHIP